MEICPRRVDDVGQKGSFFPYLLEMRKRSEQVLLAVIQEATIQGISTRKVSAFVYLEVQGKQNSSL